MVLHVKQKSKGTYVAIPIIKWDSADISKRRVEHLSRDTKRKRYYFRAICLGRLGERTLEEHNERFYPLGWDNEFKLTRLQAVVSVFSMDKGTKPQTFTLKDVPVKAFWS